MPLNSTWQSPVNLSLGEQQYGSITTGDVKKDSTSMALQTAAYCILVVFSLVGNSFIVTAVFRNTNKRMRTVSNIFIVNLCVADLIVTVVNIPGKISQIYIGRLWLVDGAFGFVLCKIMGSVPYLGVAVSTQSFSLLSIDRFVAVFFPIKKPITTTIAYVLVLTTWLFAFGFYFVYCHSSALMTDANNNTVCGIDLSAVFGTEEHFNHFVWAEFFIITVIPLTVSAIFYTSTMIKLFRRKIPGAETSANVSYSERMNRRILKMLVTVFLVFFLCWSPSWVWAITCLRENTATLPGFCSSTQYHMFRFLAAYSNSAITPYLYLIFSQNYRQGFKDILGAIACCPVLAMVLRGGNRVGMVVEERRSGTAATIRGRSRGLTRLSETVI